MSENPYLTMQEAADLLGCHRVRISQRIAAGELKQIFRLDVPPEFRSFHTKSYVLRSEILDRRPHHVKKGWITAHEAADLLGVSYPTVVYYIRMGYLKPLHLPSYARRKGIFHYFDPAVVEELRDNPRPRPLPDYPYSPSEIDLAYLAGLVDGEGSIVITRSVFQTETRYAIALQIYNTYAPALEWVSATFGGRTYPVKRTRADWRACYIWRNSGMMVYHMLCRTLPYMKIKHEQAKLAISFHEHVLSFHASRWNKITTEELAWRDEQKQLLSRLNNGLPPSK